MPGHSQRPPLEELRHKVLITPLFPLPSLAPPNVPTVGYLPRHLAEVGRFSQGADWDIASSLPGVWVETIREALTGQILHVVFGSLLGRLISFL